MKKLVFTLLILSSFNLFASEKCTVTGYGAIFNTNGSIFNESEIADLESITKEKSWQDCYIKALKMAKNYYSSLPATVSGWIIKEGKVKTTFHIFMKWRFNDSKIPMMDTKGKITKYTDKYESYPIEGDARYFSDGRLFK